MIEVRHLPADGVFVQGALPSGLQPAGHGQAHARLTDHGARPHVLPVHL